MSHVSYGDTSKGDGHVVLTLSFDDGFKTDIKLAELLEAYNLKATFFVIAGKIGYSSVYLSSEDICWLSEFHEVGSHTVRHSCLTLLDQDQLNYEIKTSKLLLERIIGKEVVGFAYPYGIFNRRVRKCVRNAGYLYARTIIPYWVGAPRDIKDRYSLPVTFHLYLEKINFDNLKLLVYNITRRQRKLFSRICIDYLLSNVKALLCRTSRSSYIDYIDLAKIIIALAIELSRNQGGGSYIISLWGHSYEIIPDKDLRLKFEDLLCFIASLKKYVKVITLRELVEEYLINNKRQ